MAFFRQFAVARVIYLIIIAALRSLPRQAFKIGDGERAALQVPDRGFGQRMLGRLFQAEEHIGSFGGRVLCPCHLRHHWPAFRQRARLVHHEGVRPSGRFQTFRVLDEDAQFRSLADAHHDGGRRGQSEGTGAGDDEHRDEGQQAVGETVFRREGPPAGEGN